MVGLGFEACHFWIEYFKLLEFLKIVSASGFVDNFLIVFVGEFCVVDGVGPLDAFGDIVVELFHELGLISFDLFGDLACVGLEQVEGFQALLVFALRIL